MEYLTELVKIHNARIQALESTTDFDYILPEDYNSVKRNLLLPFPRADISSNYNISDADQNFGY